MRLTMTQAINKLEANLTRYSLMIVRLSKRTRKSKKSPKPNTRQTSIDCDGSILGELARAGQVNQRTVPRVLAVASMLFFF
jgi:hypothetical protein